MSQISRFTNKVITLAKNAVSGRGETAYALVSLHYLHGFTSTNPTATHLIY